MGSTSPVPVICTVRVPPKYVINYEYSSRQIIMKMSYFFITNRLHRIQNHIILNCGTLPSKMLKNIGIVYTCMQNYGWLKTSCST